MENVNDIYFDGQYKEMWRSIIPAELTTKEVDFMLSYFGLTKGSQVLDLMCGYGRHAIALARKEISVTAIDNLDDYIKEINKNAKDQDIPVKGIKADILQYVTDEKYDLVLCMGNSLNFFNAEDVNHLLINIHSYLKPGGHLLINTWSLAEIAIKSFAAKSSNEVNGIKHICDSQYLFHPTRIESESIFLSPDGSIEKKKAVDYIFSVAEMETLLAKAGFYLTEIFSIPGKKKFTLGEPRAYIVAKRV